MIPKEGVFIIKADQGVYVVIWHKKDESAHRAFSSLDEGEPINFYTVNGFPLRFRLMTFVTPGYELKTQVFLTMDKVLEYLSTIEVLQ